MAPRGHVVVIGSGAAGSAAARRLAEADWQVTVVEADRVGGTCLWHGCIPKKALYASARSLRHVSESEQFGILSANPVVDWPGVLAWKWHAQETYAGDQEAILSDRGIRLAKGAARFASPGSVLVGDAPLEFDHAVIATGSVPVIPDVPGAELADTSADALGYPEPPSSLLIVGAGYIAFELAGIFASVGSAVTVAVSSRPLKQFDPDVVAIAVRHLEALGVSFISGARIQSLAVAGDGLTATFATGDATPTTVNAQRVILATGRRPALDGLDLSAGGIDTDAHGGLVLGSSLQTTNPGVWAAGDAAGGMMQTPVASMHGGVVARSIISGSPLPLDTFTVPTTVFTVPQLARVGLTEEQAKADGIPYRAGVTDFEYVGSAIIDDDRDGLVKLLFAKEDDRLLGAHIAAPNASDLIHSMAIGVATGATSGQLQKVLGIHPGYSEALNWTAH